MAAKKQTKPKVKRFGFGRREKLVVIGVLAIVGIAAVHFVLFNPRQEALQVIRGDYTQTQNRYNSLLNQNYPRAEIQEYVQATDSYRGELYEIIDHEMIAIRGWNSQTADTEIERFNNSVRDLTNKWQAYADDPDVHTNLIFTQQQTARSADDLDRIHRQIAAGQYLWNLPESLPEGVTQSQVLDDIQTARNQYRLIQSLRNDRIVQTRRQAQYNSVLRGLGIEPTIIGADQVTYPDPQWETFRLPDPVGLFSATAQIELILDTILPPPAFIDRAISDPSSLSDNERQEYDRWRESRRVQREGSDHLLGLEEMFDVEFNDLLVSYNRIIEHVERLVDLAVEHEIASIIMIKVEPYKEVKEIPDPNEIPTEDELAEEAGQGQFPQYDAYGPEAGGFNPEMGGFDPETAGVYGAYGPMAGYGGGQRATEQVVEEQPTILYTIPLFIQITGDYANVWSYILDISVGPHLYVVEELSIYTHQENGRPTPNLEEGQVAADIWLSVPVLVPAITQETGVAAADYVETHGGVEEEPVALQTETTTPTNSEAIGG